MALPYMYYQIASTQWHFCIQCRGLRWAPNLHRWCKPLQGGHNWELWFVLSAVREILAGLLHLNKRIGTTMTKWGPCNNQQKSNVLLLKPPQWGPSQPSRNHDDCVWFLEGHKEGTMTKLFLLVWKIDPSSPPKKTPPQLPHDLPHSIFVCVRVWVHAGHGVVRHYQRFWPAKRVSMVVPNAPKLTALPPKVVNAGFSGFQLCWFFCPHPKNQHKLK